MRAGGMRVLGTPMHLSRITVPTFVTGAVTDHLTPWEGCYRTTQLLSGPSTFVLSNAGHIQSLVNPPGNPKASYWTGGEPGPDAHAGGRPPSGTRAAGGSPGRSGCSSAPATRSRRARSAGSPDHPVLEPAPGSYVVDRAPGLKDRQRMVTLPVSRSTATRPSRSAAAIIRRVNRCRRSTGGGSIGA